MAEEPQYTSTTTDNTTPTMKRKYDDQTTPPHATLRRPTGFSAPIASPPSDSTPSYKNVPPPVDEFQLAKQKAQEIAARIFNNASSTAEVKRPRVDNGFDDKGFSSPYSDVGGQKSMMSGGPPSSYPGSYGFQGSSKKIDIPNGRVGVIIGKGGETIKYLQLQSGAKIQVTRDAEADPNSPNRLVELMGTPDQIAKAEQLINEVLNQADAGGSNLVSRRLPGQTGGEQFVMKIPNNKVGLVIGKGGETIKNMQASTGARIQVIPLHLPPGDTSTERTLQIDGSSDQIEHAKQLVNEVISENRARNPAMAGGNPQGYGARPQANWSQSGGPPMQQGYGGYVQPGAYPGSSGNYNMSQASYGGYPPQPTSGGYTSNWDQSSAPQGQQGSGYDYYSQQPPPQNQAQGGTTPADNTVYNYNQPPSGYSQQGQSYSQGSYGGYNAPQPGYDQTNTHPGYDQQQSYNTTSSYGSGTNPNQEGNTQSYGAQGDTASVGQQGYSTNQQPSPNSTSYPSQASAPQSGYGMPPSSQPAYGNQPPMQPGYGPGYGPPQGQKPLATPVYGQAQQSPNAQGASYVQPGYPHSQPPPAAQTGYAQADSSSQRVPPSSYGTPTAQPGYGHQSYGAPPNAHSGYGQQPPPYNGSYGTTGYQQPPVYPADGSSGGSTRVTYEAAPASQAVPQSGAKASPPS